MANFINRKQDIANYPNADISKFNSYILGGLLVDAEAEAGTYDEAKTKAKMLAYQKARRKVESECGRSYPFLEIQDPMPAGINPAQIMIDTSVQNGNQWTVTTLDAMIDATGYKRGIFFDRHIFGMPALVYEQSQVSGLEKVKSIWTDELVSPFKDVNYSKSVVGRAVAPTEAEATNKAVNNAYKELRNFLKNKGDAFILVPNQQTLAGILEVWEQDNANPNKARLEKVYNVYAHKR